MDELGVGRLVVGGGGGSEYLVSNGQMKEEKTATVHTIVRILNKKRSIRETKLTKTH